MEKPAGTLADKPKFVSDHIATAVRDTGVKYIALNPGASYRGLHDSLVNYLGNEAPQMLVCLHEEHAVAIAHGYAKVTEQPMAAALHTNVGLMHGSMAIYNAWCDRAPVLIVGATGPLDAASRRPWIDWIHTSADLAAMIRGYIKWDDQPMSAEAARESLMRGSWIARTLPRGPVYVNLDTGLQESAAPASIRPATPARYQSQTRFDIGPEDLESLRALFAGSSRPVLLMGRVSRDVVDWERRVALAEALGAVVITDLKVAGAFPTDHPAHVGPAAIFPSAPVLDAIRKSDLIVSLDWVDLAGTLGKAFEQGEPEQPVVQVSVDHTRHNGWSKDHQGWAPVDLFISADPDRTIRALAAASSGTKAPWMTCDAARKHAVRNPSPCSSITVNDIAASLRNVLDGTPNSLLQVPLSWDGDSWTIEDPLAYLGTDGGGGIGSGPGISTGAALALKDSGRLPVAVLGDGNFIMGCTAFWTAVHYTIPLLVVIANNRSFYNDEVHQERMAVIRERPVENKWIGMRLEEPDLDLAGMARSQGAIGFGPISRLNELGPVLSEAVTAVKNGNVAVVDVRTVAGYGN